MWMRVKPDIPFVGFSTRSLLRGGGQARARSQGRRRAPGFHSMPGFGGQGAAADDRGRSSATPTSAGRAAKPRAPTSHEDWAVVQAVDPDTGREVPDGEWGNLVVTTLDRDNGLLRYDLEEAAAITREPCPCGETAIRGFWGGRFKDLLTSQGKRFQVAELERALRSGAPETTEPTLEYVIVRPPAADGPLTVRIEAGSSTSDRSSLAEQCRAAIHEHLELEARVEVLDRETLPRSGFKATRVVDV